MHGTVVKDSQNPYRTGVLIGNHVEDRFGVDIAQKDVSPSFPFGNNLENLEAMVDSAD